MRRHVSKSDECHREFGIDVAIPCDIVHILEDTFLPYLGQQLLHRKRRILLPELQRAAVHYGKRVRRGDAEEPPEEAATTDVALCPIALASARMPLGHMEDEAEEAEESDVALGHIEEEAEEAEDEAPDGGPWMRVSTA